MKTSRTLLAALLLLPALVAFGDEPEITSAEGGVVVTTRFDAWPENEPIEEGVTPIKLRIENKSDREILLRFGDFVLESETGEKYAALPLHDALLAGLDEAEEEALAVESKSVRVAFRIAPGYSQIFPGTEAFPSHFAENRDYTEYHSTYWDPTRVPTVEMFERLLPEGALGPGGTVDGFLYFQRVDAPESDLELELRLVDAESDKPFGTITLPLAGDDDKDPR